MHELEAPPSEPRASSVPLVSALAGAIALGGLGALGASSFGVVAAIVSGLGAAGVGAAGALAIATGRRWVGAAVIAVGLGAISCCGLGGLAFLGVRSLVPDSATLEPVAVEEHRWLRHPSLGFLVPDPGEEWHDISSSPAASVAALALRPIGRSEGTWMWRHPEYGAVIMVVALRPSGEPAAENARAFLEGMVGGGLSGDVAREPSLVRWGDERREIWARASGMKGGAPLGNSARYLAWRDASGDWQVLVVFTASHPDDDWTSYLLEAHAPGERWRGPGAPPAGFEPSGEPLLAARAAHATEITRPVAFAGPPLPPPDDGPLELVRYDAPSGALWAYRSRNATQLARGEERRPAVLWIHGGYSIDAGPEAAAFTLAEAGLVVMAPTLRGDCGNPGTIEVFRGELDDARAALDHLRSLPAVDPDRVVVMGHSIGGTLALLLAETAAPARAFFAFGPTADAVSFAELGPDELGPVYDLRRIEESWVRSPIAFLAGIEAPTFVVEGELGNASQARALEAAAPPGSPLRVIVAPGGDHWSVVDPVIALLARRLHDPAPLTLSRDEVAQIAAAAGRGAEALDEIRTRPEAAAAE